VTSQHLSDEAIAAFADGVLSSHARERAARHAAGCAECAHAVTVQREAVWALRAAPAPALPLGLMDRLRSVPVTTPMARPTSTIPSAMSADGSALFSAFGSMATAALVPNRPSASANTTHRMRPIVMTAAAVAFAGALAVGSGVNASNVARPVPARSGSSGSVQAPSQIAEFVQAPQIVPVNARLRIGR
jgi:anti-sigma factor RsiW